MAAAFSTKTRAATPPHWSWGQFEGSLSRPPLWPAVRCQPCSDGPDRLLARTGAGKHGMQVRLPAGNAGPALDALRRNLGKGRPMWGNLGWPGHRPHLAGGGAARHRLSGHRLWHRPPYGRRRRMAKAKEARDRVALVTGAGSGIGRATVGRLLDARWKVAAVDQNATALASLAASVAKPQRLFTQALDVTNEPATEKAIAMAGEALGRIDGVVNSAGIAADIPA